MRNLPTQHRLIEFIGRDVLEPAEAMEIYQGIGVFTRQMIIIRSMLFPSPFLIGGVASFGGVVRRLIFVAHHFSYLFAHGFSPYLAECRGWIIWVDLAGDIFSNRFILSIFVAAYNTGFLTLRYLLKSSGGLLVGAYSTGNTLVSVLTWTSLLADIFTEVFIERCDLLFSFWGFSPGKFSTRDLLVGSVIQWNFLTSLPIGVLGTPCIVLFLKVLLSRVVFSCDMISGVLRLLIRITL